jgi:hypothetical protein
MQLKKFSSSKQKCCVYEQYVLTDYDGVRLTSQNGGHHWPIVHAPGECEWRAVVMMMPPGEAPDLSTGARWQSYQQRHLERVGGMDEIENFAYSVSLIR